MRSESGRGPARTKSVEDVAERLGCSAAFLYQRRSGNVIDMGGGQELRLIRIGRRFRVADIELARFLGEPFEVERSEAGPDSRGTAVAGRDVTQEERPGPAPARIPQQDTTEPGGIRAHVA